MPGNLRGVARFRARRREISLRSGWLDLGSGFPPPRDPSLSSFHIAPTRSNNERWRPAIPHIHCTRRLLYIYGGPSRQVGCIWHQSAALVPGGAAGTTPSSDISRSSIDALICNHYCRIPYLYNWPIIPLQPPAIPGSAYGEFLTEISPECIPDWRGMSRRSRGTRTLRECVTTVVRLRVCEWCSSGRRLIGERLFYDFCVHYVIAVRLVYTIGVR